MNLPKLVATLRLRYHLEAVDINNVLYQLHLRSGNKADRLGAKHCMAAIDCFERLGVPICNELKKQKVKES